MALPATIGDSDVRWPDYCISYIGPFVNGTDLYACLVDKTNNQIEVWRSTDGGDTWSEQDSANKPSCSAVDGRRTCYAVQSGAAFFVAYPSNSADATNIKPFSMSTNVWGTAITAGPVIQATAAPNGTFPLLYAIRSDKSHVIFYNGATQSVMGTAYTRIKIHYYNGAWNGPFDVVGSANSPLANTLPGTQIDYSARTAVLGASDRVHLFWTASTSGSLFQRSLLSGNTFASFQPVVDEAQLLVGQLNKYTCGTPTSYVQGSDTNLVIPFQVTTGPFSIGLAINRAASADQPSWGPQSISDSGHGPNSASGNMSAVLDDTTVYAFWGSNNIIYFDDDGGFGVFGTDEAWKSSIGPSGISLSRYFSSADYIGVLYNDSGTVKFDRFRIRYTSMMPNSGIIQPLVE